MKNTKLFLLLIFDVIFGLVYRSVEDEDLRRKLMKEGYQKKHS